MITFERHLLPNGLTVIHHLDTDTPFVVVNVLYKTGARDESPEKTGFAHLFEHLMFEGTKQAPSYDTPLQEAGGENNAFTTNDYTNYYSMVPAVNAEISFWLEADRMQNLNINAKSLKVQKKVVIEEFKEHYINQPYGNVWHILREMVYTSHPYRWPTIGLIPEHIADASQQDVKDFYHTYYNTSNAILVVGGNISAEECFRLSEKWFGSLPGKAVNRQVVIEPVQAKQRRKTVYENVPVSAMYLVFRNCERLNDDYYTADLVADILSTGQSSRLQSKLVKEKGLFTEIEAYADGNIEAGMFIIEGRLNEGVSPEEAEKAIWDELNELSSKGPGPEELTKVINKAITSILFTDSDILGRAITLAYYEMLGDAAWNNEEENKYSQVTAAAVAAYSRKYFLPENSSVLYYLNKGDA